MKRVRSTRGTDVLTARCKQAFGAHRRVLPLALCKAVERAADLDRVLSRQRDRHRDLCRADLQINRPIAHVYPDDGGHILVTADRRWHSLNALARSVLRHWPGPCTASAARAR